MCRAKLLIENSVCCAEEIRSSEDAHSLWDSDMRENSNVAVAKYQTGRLDKINGYSINYLLIHYAAFIQKNSKDLHK